MRSAAEVLLGRGVRDGHQCRRLGVGHVDSVHDTVGRALIESVALGALFLEFAAAPRSGPSSDSVVVVALRRVSGETGIGLLSGVEGVPEGIAVPLAGNQWVTRDVLGGTAADVAAGWAEMEAAIAAWTPDNNSMPSLASRPMRIVEWATFRIGSDSLDDAHEFAGHAQLHVDVAGAAPDC